MHDANPSFRRKKKSEESGGGINCDKWASYHRRSEAKTTAKILKMTFEMIKINGRPWKEFSCEPRSLTCSYLWLELAWQVYTTKLSLLLHLSWPGFAPLAKLGCSPGTVLSLFSRCPMLFSKHLKMIAACSLCWLVCLSAPSCSRSESATGSWESGRSEGVCQDKPLKGSS